jgi:hypothetical protein
MKNLLVILPTCKSRCRSRRVRNDDCFLHVFDLISGRRSLGVISSVLNNGTPPEDAKWEHRIEMHTQIVCLSTRHLHSIFQFDLFPGQTRDRKLCNDCRRDVKSARNLWLISPLSFYFRLLKDTPAIPWRIFHHNPAAYCCISRVLSLWYAYAIFWPIWFLHQAGWRPLGPKYSSFDAITRLDPNNSSLRMSNWRKEIWRVLTESSSEYPMS